MNIREIAKQAGVSTATVSRVINGNPRVKPELKDKVNSVIKKANYVPNAIARSMNNGITMNLGLVLPDITNPFFPGIARGIEDAASNMGYKVILCNTDNHTETEDSYLRMLRSQRVDGLILVSSGIVFEEQFPKVLADIPVVLCDRDPGTGYFSSVITNHHDGVKIALEHLIDLGHRHIAMITGPAISESRMERLRYFKEFLKESGLESPDHRVITGDYQYESGYIAMRQIMNDKAVTAVFCANDMMAFGAMQAAFEAGLEVPSDLSIVGYDNIPFSNWSRPALTTVSQPTYLLGMTAFEILIERINNKSLSPIQKLLDPTLVIRQSTAKVSP